MPPKSKDKKKEENEQKTHKKSCGVNSESIVTTKMPVNYEF